MQNVIRGAAQRKRILHAALAITSLSWILSSNGCSLIGLGLGAAADARNPGKEIPIPAGLDTLSVGTDLILVTRDHKTIRGRYLSKGVAADKLYPVKFDQWRSHSKDDSSRWVPPFGTAIYVGASIESRQVLLSGAFAGFDSGTVRIESPRGSDAIGIKIENVVDFRDSSGKSLADRLKMIHTFAAGVPLASRVGIPSIMIAGTSKLNIALEDILTISVAISGDAKWTGLVIGAAVDVVVVIIGTTVVANLPHF